MFSGIVSGLGSIKSIKDKNDIVCIEIKAPKNFGKKLQKGASVSVDGVCLTAKKKNDAPDATKMAQCGPHDPKKVTKTAQDCPNDAKNDTKTAQGDPHVTKNATKTPPMTPKVSPRRPE